MGWSLSLPRRGRVVGEADRVGNISLKLSIDCLQNAVQISVYIIIPKAKHSEPLFGEIRVSHGIASCVCIGIVLAAIDFDDELRSQPDEVQDATGARRLTPKVITSQS
jgi:hypothetical protein